MRCRSPLPLRAGLSTETVALRPPLTLSSKRTDADVLASNGPPLVIAPYPTPTRHVTPAGHTWNAFAEDDIAGGMDRLALLLVMIEQAALDQGSWQTAWIMGLLDDPPDEMLRRHVTGSAMSRVFAPLADQGWATVALSYVRELDAITQRREEKRNPRQLRRPGRGGGQQDQAEEAEQAGSAVTTSRDASTAGGKLYYEMHTTRFEVARGSVERKQARERGFTAGALARINNI